MAFSSHDLPWVPTQKDMEAPQTLKGVEVKGGYTSLQECADIHYELMKEDFMRPLRDGIERFKTQNDIHSPGVQFHFNVRIVDIIFMDKIHHRLQFDSSQVNADHCEDYQGLDSGSLLLFSCNHFKTYVFAIVASRRVDLLANGCIDVDFIPDRDSLSQLLTSSDILVMAEARTFYPLYCHVLSALKQAKICNRLQEYIIKCGRRLERPAYLTMKSKYDMSCIMNEEKPCSIELLRPEAWLDIKETCLNEAQKAAVQFALTKELALIQGPPGTGKTFVCLKLIETFLNNDKNPILVLCKSTDALDRILEKVCSFGTTQIVRSAGKSKSDQLEMLSLDIIKKEMEKNKEFSKELQSSFWKLAQMLAKISIQIAECHHQLESLGTEIQLPGVLIEHMSNSHRKTVRKGRWSVSNWLSENEYAEDAVDRKTSVNNLKDMKILQELSSSTLLPMSEKEEAKVKNLKLLKLPQRLSLYKYWLNKFKKQLSEKLVVLLKDYDATHDKIVHINKQKTVVVLQAAAVIGMTTREAAKHCWELGHVKCKIVIVEDAAKVFESHILASLNQWCEHLILIGDHQLVSPTSVVADLMTDYNLGVSLFERLVNNGIPYVQLNEQYRMGSSISKLIHCIYPNLKDCTPHLTQNGVPGVSKNVFFIDHNHIMNKCGLTGKRAHFCEADFLALFCRYLLLQHPSNLITILTTHFDQMLAIKKRLSTMIKLSPSVVVSTVDRYKYREDDIILLSFTRSKEEIRNGFPIAINQVSQAFSRAKNGFYAIGDFESLKSQSKLWSDIIDSAMASGNLGAGLPLTCGLTVTCAVGFNMYISYEKLQAINPAILKYDFSKSAFTVKEFSTALFNIKCAHCLLQIEKMDVSKTYCEKFTTLRDEFNHLSLTLGNKEKEKLRIHLACLLYLVAITELELCCQKDKKHFKESLHLPIQFWKVKLTDNDIDEIVVDNADDFVEMLMLSMVKDVKKCFTKVLERAKEIDRFNAVLYSNNSQNLVDLEHQQRRLVEKPRTLMPHPISESRSKANAIYGRLLYWRLAEKPPLPRVLQQNWIMNI